MAEKNLPTEMQEKEHNEELLEKIRNIEDKIKSEKGTDNLNVKYYEDCEINMGGTLVKVSIAEVKRKKDEKELSEDKNKEKDENELEKKSYKIYMNIKGQDLEIAEIDEQGNLILNEENLELIDPKNVMGLKELGEDEKPDISQINEIEGKTSEELEEEIAKE